MIFTFSLSACRATQKTHCRIMYLLFLSVLLLLPGMVSAARADDSYPVEIARKLQKTYENATNLVADFNQITSMKFSARVRKGSGTMIFMKPGRMRWDYLTPDYQVLISDGETISMYFEKSGQMIISNAKEYLQSDVTYSFFTGSGDILKDFDPVEPDFENEAENSYLIKLVPKSTHPHVAYMHAWINTDTFLLEHLQIIDHFDTATDLFFYNVKVDVDFYGGRPISPDLFSFNPPDGTELIRQ